MPWVGGMNGKPLEARLCFALAYYTTVRKAIMFYNSPFAHACTISQVRATVMSVYRKFHSTIRDQKNVPVVGVVFQ